MFSNSQPRGQHLRANNVQGYCPLDPQWTFCVTFWRAPHVRSTDQASEPRDACQNFFQAWISSQHCRRRTPWNVAPHWFCRHRLPFIKFGSLLFSRCLLWPLFYIIETASKCHQRQLIFPVDFCMASQAAQATHVQPAIRSTTVDAAVIAGRKIMARFRVRYALKFQ
jgi:hypothetical protein